MAGSNRWKRQIRSTDYTVWLRQIGGLIFFTYLAWSHFTEHNYVTATSMLPGVLGFLWRIILLIQGKPLPPIRPWQFNEKVSHISFVAALLGLCLAFAGLLLLGPTIQGSQYLEHKWASFLLWTASLLAAYLVLYFVFRFLLKSWQKRRGLS
jgi:hypothetical protein